MGNIATKGALRVSEYRWLPAIFTPYVCVAVGMYLLGSAWAAMLGYHAVAVVLTVMHEKKEIFRLVPKGFKPIFALVILPLSAAAGFVLWLVWPYMFVDSTGIWNSLTVFGLPKSVWPVFALYYALVNSFVEEIFWRGALRNVRPHVVVDLGFAGYHALVLFAFVSVPWAVALAATLYPAAWMWRQVAKRTGGLALCIASHVVADVAIAAFVWSI